MLTLSKSVNHALLAHCSDADTEYSPVRATGRNRVRPRQIFCLLDISTMNSRDKSTLVTLHVRTTSWVRRASLTRDLELLFLQAHHKHSNTTLTPMEKFTSESTRERAHTSKSTLVERVCLAASKPSPRPKRPQRHNQASVAPESS